MKYIIRIVIGLLISGFNGLTVYKNSSRSTVSMSLLSLKSKLPDPIDRYCIYILSYPSMSITLCINHIIRFFLLKNILHGLTLVLPCFHLYRIRFLRPQRFQIEVNLPLPIVANAGVSRAISLGGMILRFKSRNTKFSLTIPDTSLSEHPI